MAAFRGETFSTLAICISFISLLLRVAGERGSPGDQVRGLNFWRISPQLEFGLAPETIAVRTLSIIKAGKLSNQGPKWLALRDGCWYTGLPTSPDGKSLSAGVYMAS